MLKWIKNTYYSWRNRQYMDKITDLQQARRRGYISELNYRLHTEMYREKIMGNLDKITL